MSLLCPSVFLFTLALALAGQAAAAVPIASNLPPHPRLTISARDLPAIKGRVATHAQAREAYQTLQKEADAWLNRTISLPPRGAQWYHYYSCPKHGARLRTEGPTRHVCPVDGEVLAGYPYDDVVLSGEHNRLAGAVRTLGWVYQVSSDPRYAAKAREILLAYAARYESYPLHNIKGEAKVGGGKVGPQTLDESTWLITLLEGADLIWTTLSGAEREQVAQGLIHPATTVIRQHKMGVHNIQCWKNSAVGLAGLLLGDLALVQEAINGPAGHAVQAAQGVSADGSWYEGAWGYHFYTLSAMLHLTEAAFHCGINLYGPEIQRMFDGPILMAMPNLVLPAFNDSHEVNLRQQSALYEIASLRFPSAQYASVLAGSRRSTEGLLLRGAKTPDRPAPRLAASRDLPAAGFAVLSSGEGANATWFGLDYGPHGGGHGHPDKLAFVLYARGRVLAPDPGTANYGVPIQAGWHRATLAHNTLTVDEQSQKAAEGRCLAFLATQGFNAVMAEAGKIYDGVVFIRTAALIGTNILAVIDQVKAATEHTMDLAYHQHGRWLDLPAGASPCKLGSKPGYAYLRDSRQVTSSQGVTLQFETSGVGRVAWSMAHGEPTTFITATGVGAHTEDRVPVVLARRRARETAFLWAVNLSGKAEDVTLTPESVQASDPAAANQVRAAAVRLTTPLGSFILVANPGEAETEVAGQRLSSRLACLEQTGAGAWSVKHLAPPP